MSHTSHNAHPASTALASRCACGGKDYAALWHGSYTRGGSTQDQPYHFHLQRCRRCSLVRTDPVPDQSMYDALDFDDDGAPHVRPWLYDAAGEMLTVIRANGYRAGAVLDVGCNTGELVHAISSMGVDAAGCDIDLAAVDHGVAEGRRLFHLNLESDGVPGVYAAALCIHTLEHTLKPVDLLRNHAGSLKPGAPLYIAVPNFGGLAARIMRDRWGYLVPRQHVWQFTPRTLRDTVERTGAFVWVSSAQRTTLEPSASLSVKRLILELAGKLNEGDEIRAVFRRV